MKIPARTAESESYRIISLSTHLFFNWSISNWMRMGSRIFFSISVTEPYIFLSAPATRSREPTPTINMFADLGFLFYHIVLLDTLKISFLDFSTGTYGTFVRGLMQPYLLFYKNCLPNFDIIKKLFGSRDDIRYHSSGSVRQI
jgi:hypothetical protein